MFPFPTPLLAAGQSAGGPTDPYWANVVLLCGYNVAGNVLVTTANLVDESPAAHTPDTVSGGTGVPSYSSSSPKFGIACLDTGNSSPCTITFPDHNDFSPGAGDFTIESFFFQRGSQTKALITKFNGSTQKEWGIFVRPTLLEWYHSTTGADQSTINYNPNFTVNDNAWHHTAFSRVGNTGHLCFDGTIVNTMNMTGVTIFNSTAKLAIAGNNNGTSAQFLGGLDETRITKGVGRYSGSIGSSYTVPTAAFPRS